jgi:hypothetical protein
MKAIEFVVRDSAGGLQRGAMSADAANQTIVAGAGQEISINARQSDFASQVRSGDQLVITLSDGRILTIDNFFNDNGAANRLFVSADGYLNEVSFVDAGQGNLYAQYGPTAEWGKWSASDDLIFLGNSEVAGVPLADGDGDVSMLGGALLGGGSLLGTGAGVAAAVIGGGVLLGGGGGGGGGPAGPRAPYVDGPDANVVIGGDDDDTDTIIVSGGGEPGDNVTVTIGDKVVETVIKDNGTFEAEFKGDTFPEDGVYDAVVVVDVSTGPDVTLDGPSYEIDLTAPELTFTEGTESNGDFFNGATFVNGVTIEGTGEAGATVAVTIAGVTRTTVVSESGTWSTSWEAGTLEAGEYTTGIKAVTTDSYGNSKTFNDTLVVDTVTTVTVNTATVGGDGVVNGVEHAAGVTFTGTAQAGATVEVTVGTVTRTATATSSGTWSSSFTATQIVVGEYNGTVSVKATDTFGNVASTSGSFVVDTLVRDFAITSTTGGADGVINAVEAAQALTVSGTTEPGSTVKVELGGVTTTAVVSASGSWTATFAAGSVAAGTYTATMTATATDAAGNIDTATASVKVDTEAGLLTIDSTPVEGDDIVNQLEASDGVVLTGTADPGALVTVTMEGVSHDVVTNASGNWEAFFSASEVAAGVYTAEITAITTDAYGNSRTASDSVEVDTRVDNLSINQADIAGDNIISAAEYNGIVTVTGTTEVGSTSVMVTMGGVTVAATGAASGNWSAQFNANVLPQGTSTHQIGVVATDHAGNTKPATATVQVDTEVKPFDMTSTPGGADGVLNVAEAAAGIDLGGSVEVGSTVTVRFDNRNYEATVNPTTGDWSLTIPQSAIRTGFYDTQITITAKDHVGNTAVINDTLTIDTQAPDGPIIRSFTEGNDGGFRGISVQTVMENGAATTDTADVHQVGANGSISEVSFDESFNTTRRETRYEFDQDVPNGAQLIVNATDAAGNTSGTLLVLNDQDASRVINLGNAALGEYQISSLNLDFAEAARVVIDEASLLALSTQTNTLTIHGTREDSVTIQGGVAQGTHTVNGQTFNQYAVGAEGTLLVDQDIPVTI